MHLHVRIAALALVSWVTSAPARASTSGQPDASVAVTTRTDATRTDAGTNAGAPTVTSSSEEVIRPAPAAGPPESATAISPDAGAELPAARRPKTAGGASPGLKPKAAELTPLPAPLGRIGDVLLSPNEAARSTDWVRSFRFPGCEKEVRISLARLLSGVAAAGAQVQRWVEQQPGGHKRFFTGSASPLVEAFSRARLSVPGEADDAALCAPLEEGWKLAAARAVAKPCPQTGSRTSEGALHRFRLASPKPKSTTVATAWAYIAPAAGEAKDRCLPRMSVTLFDSKGRARLRYHADYSGALEAELLGDRCRSIVLTFDRSTDRFLPTARAGGQGCAQKSSLHRP